MFAKPFRLAAGALCAVVLIALGGCSDRPKTAAVRGTLTYKGKPVPRGTISFIPADGPAATGEIGPDGSYQLTTFKPGDGAILGPHKVVIVAMEDLGGRALEAWSPLPPPLVPVKYTSLGTTDLRAEVNEGENTINFALTDDRRK